MGEGLRNVEEWLDLRALAITLRRATRVLVAFGLAGSLLGLLYAWVRPPLYSSATWVLLPASGDTPDTPGGRSVETSIEIVRGGTVLGAAGKSLTPPISAEDLRRGHVTVSARSGDVLEIVGLGETPELAAEISTAVASANIDFVNGRLNALSEGQRTAINERLATLQKSLDELTPELERARNSEANADAATTQPGADSAMTAQLTAQQTEIVLRMDDLKKQLEVSAGTAQIHGSANASIIQQASPPQRAGLVPRYALIGTIGAGVGLLVGSGVVVTRRRREGRLVLRDDIAGAIGVPVLASMTYRVHDTVAGWRDLLLTPPGSDTQIWDLRQVLRRIRGSGFQQVNADGKQGTGGSVMVLTLGGDSAALGVAPQLAVHAATTGVPTRFVFTHEDDDSAVLAAACRGVPEDALPPNLSIDTEGTEPSSDFAIHLVVVDRTHPSLPVTPSPDVVPQTLLVVSAGFATSKELARVALHADDVGRHLCGTIVTEPDPMDRSTGSLVGHLSGLQAWDDGLREEIQ
ncbi:MAG: hypothetical protein CSA84_05090 [Actinomycetales bacterium]|nr:MAG: hypothetical protein CSA84_05090 [Actinomycetales bacterium]